MGLNRVLAASALLCVSSAHGAAPFFGTGIKIGEVDSDSAIVWVRLGTIVAPVPTNTTHMVGIISFSAHAPMYQPWPDSSMQIKTRPC